MHTRVTSSACALKNLYQHSSPVALWAILYWSQYTALRTSPCGEARSNLTRLVFYLVTTLSRNALDKLLRNVCKSVVKVLSRQHSPGLCGSTCSPARSLLVILTEPLKRSYLSCFIVVYRENSRRRLVPSVLSLKASLEPFYWACHLSPYIV